MTVHYFQVHRNLRKLKNTKNQKSKKKKKKKKKNTHTHTLESHILLGPQKVTHTNYIFYTDYFIT